jgi:hypothetical protein
MFSWRKRVAVVTDVDWIIQALQCLPLAEIGHVQEPSPETQIQEPENAFFTSVLK